jgi:hypothetical protein
MISAEKNLLFQTFKKYFFFRNLFLEKKIVLGEKYFLDL